MKTKIGCLLLMLWGMTVTLAAEGGAALPDGFYLGGGAKDAAAVLQPVALKVVKGFLEAEDNGNTLFSLQLEGECAPEIKVENVVLVCQGKRYRVEGWSHDKGACGLTFTIRGLQDANAAGRLLKLEPGLCVNPGHKLRTEFVPEKTSYVPGEKVVATLRITNTGEQSVQFRVGGQNRGPRDNQFSFTARRGEQNVPDSGDASCWGGRSYLHLLKPGETFEKKVDLGNWFAFEQPGCYDCSGSYQLEFYDTGDREKARRYPLWSDQAVGLFQIHVVPDQTPRKQRVLLKDCHDRQPFPGALYETYARFAAAAAAGDVNELSGFFLPDGLRLTEDPFPAVTRNQRTQINMTFLKNEFRPEIWAFRAGPDQTAMLVTPTSRLSFLETASGRWKLYAYEDIPQK